MTMSGKHRDNSDDPGDKSYPVGNTDDSKRGRGGSSRNDRGTHHANKGKDEPRDKK
jgi:hypothetical protein